MSKAKQEPFEYESEDTIDHAGIKHEFTGTLFVPTAEEFARIEREQQARAVPDVCLGEPSLLVPNHIARTAGVSRPRLKVDMKTALKFRSRGESTKG